MSRRHRPHGRIAAAFIALMLGAAIEAAACNDQQHQGMVALAYKAMVGTVLEAGCSTPIPFGGSPPASLRSLPDLLPCPFDSATCQGSPVPALIGERADRWRLEFLDANLETTEGSR